MEELLGNVGNMKSPDIEKGFKNKTVLVTGHTGFIGTWMCVWLQMLGSKVIGFYISARRKIDRFTLDKYFPEWNRWSDKKKKLFNRREVMAKYRKDKVLVVKDNTGYDEYYLLAGDDLQVEDGQMATPSDNAKKGEIKRLFAQNLKSNRQSRVVMNRFISQVA